MGDTEPLGHGAVMARVITHATIRTERSAGEESPVKLQTFLALPLVAGLVVAAAGCNGPVGASPTNTSTRQAGWDINEQERADLTEGGEFRGAVEVLADNWNPFSIAGGNYNFAQVRSAIGSHFFNYTADGVATPNPDFIVDVSAESNPNTVVTMKMNDLAVWGDGTPLTAADWQATWKANNGSNPDFVSATTQGWQSLTNVEQGETPQDVVFTFGTPYPDWTQFMAGGPMRAESAATPEVFNNGWGELKNEWFAGPFRVDTVDKTQKIVTLVPNERWWGNKPLLDKITWRAITPESVTSAFQSNEIDFFEVGVDADAYARANGVSGADVRQAPSPDFRQLTFNSKSRFLADQAVRQAIVMGLDRAAIARSDLAGLGVTVPPLNNNVFMANQVGYVDMAEKTGITYDVDRAKSTLEDAGWTMNDDTGIYELDGVPLTVRFTQIATIKASENEAQQVQHMLKQIGVNIVIDTVALNDFGAEFMMDGDWDIIGFSWLGTPYPFTSMRQLYGTDQYSNFARLSIDGLDELFDKMDTETDGSLRIDQANEAAEKIWTAVHTLPLYQLPALVAVKSNLANYGSFGFGTPKWEDVGYVK